MSLFDCPRCHARGCGYCDGSGRTSALGLGLWRHLFSHRADFALGAMPGDPPMLYPPVAGETYDQRIARIVRDMAGCSLSHNREKLATFVGRGVEPHPEILVTWETNCAVFALAVIAAFVGDAHAIDLLVLPLKNGEAFSRLVAVGNALGAWRDPKTDGDPVPGAILWYEIAGENDDHAEVFLSPPDEHGGGGRPDNAITVGHGDIHHSWSRPIHRWFDTRVLPMPLVAPMLEDPAPVDDTGPTGAATRGELPPEGVA